MTDDQWSRIFLAVHDGDSGPWWCPVCDSDDPNVELGQKFRGGEVIRTTVYCLSCTAQADMPASPHGVRS